MAEVRKVLAQSAPSATTLTDIYTVPALTQAVVSSISICNRSASDVAVRLSVAVAGEADATKQYIYYDLEIPANDNLSRESGVTLGAGDVIRAYVASANISINIFGVEVT